MGFIHSKLLRQLIEHDLSMGIIDGQLTRALLILNQKKKSKLDHRKRKWRAVTSKQKQKTKNHKSLPYFQTWNWNTDHRGGWFLGETVLQHYNNYTWVASLQWEREKLRYHEDWRKELMSGHWHLKTQCIITLLLRFCVYGLQIVN